MTPAAATRAQAAPATSGTAAPPGVWHVISRGWYIYAVAIVGYAIVQYLLIVPDVTPALTVPFLALVLVAYLFDVLLVVVASITASEGARGLRLGDALRPHPARRLAILIGWSCLWVAAISFAGVLNGIVGGIVVLVGAAVMPAIVAGRGYRAWFRPLRWVPVRTLLFGLMAYLLLIVATVADGEFGFLVGDPLAAALSRIVTGCFNVFILCSATVLAERAEARRASRLPAEVRPHTRRAARRDLVGAPQTES